jgi:hypothetical protein
MVYLFHSVDVAFEFKLMVQKISDFFFFYI